MLKKELFIHFLDNKWQIFSPNLKKQIIIKVRLPYGSM